MPEQATRSDSGNSVRAARLETGLTLRQLAASIGVSTGTMSAIENGKVGLTVDRLRHIAEALGVAPSHLLRSSRAVEPRDHPQQSGASAEWRMFRKVDLDQVLSSAVEVFRDTGYHGATMRLIAAGADISVAGIYHHYPSKKHLLVELVRRAHEDLRWRLDAAAAGESDPSVAFANMVEALVLFREQRRSLAYVMVTEANRVDALADEHPGPEQRDIRDAFEKAAHRAVQVGDFSSTEPHLAITAILTMCLAPSTWVEGDSTTDPAQLARSYANLALSMMRHRHHQPVQPN